MMKRLFLILALCVFGLAVFGQNIIRNPEFREGASADGIPNGWFFDGPDAVEYTASVVEEDGGTAFSIERLNDAKGLCRISSFTDNVKGDADYVLVVDMKMTGAAGDILLYDFTADGKNKDIYISVDHNNHDWQTVVKSFHSSPTCKQMKLSLVASKADGPVYFRNVKLICADDAPRTVLKELPSEPPMDADWENGVWSQAEESIPYAMLGKEFKLAESKNATFSKFGVYQGALQVITYAKESNLAGRITDREGWSNDTVEIFLRDPATRITYHVGVTATGEQCADLVNLDRLSGFAKDWFSSDTTTATIEGAEPIHFTSAIAQRKDGWVVQFAIPLDQQELKDARQIQVLLVRNRKIQERAEEYSSWGRTCTPFFKDSSGFVTMVLPASKALADDAEILPAQPAPAPETLVIPAPQAASFGEGLFAFETPLRIAAPNDKAFAMAKQLLKAQLDAEAIQSPEADAQIVFALVDGLPGEEFASLLPWQHREAYRLETGDKVRIMAEAHRGLVNGLASFCQLCAYDDAGRLSFHEAKISDWPDLEYRGWHSLAPATVGEVSDTLQFIDAMAAMKFNWLSLQFDTRLQYERHPDMGSPKAPTKEDHRRIGARLELYDIDIIPMTQCFSHFRDFLIRPELRHLAEVQEPDPKAYYQYWNYCPRHPEIHQRICDMIEEQLECYPNAKWYHAGLDEVSFEPIGVCERCKGTPGAQLFADEVKFLHDFITSKGLRMCMWCDQLEEQRNGGTMPNRTVDALPQIPRDIIVFDWHYDETDDNPTVKFLMDQGFETIACGWFFPRDVFPLAKEAARQKALGYGGTTWTWISEIRKNPHLMIAAILGAEKSWNCDGPELEALSYNPTQRFRQLYDGRSPLRPAKFRLVDLAAYGNMALAGDTRFSWMGLDADNDCSALPAGTQWLQGVPYAILSGKHAAIATADTTSRMKDYPNAVCGIQVGGTAKELRFLQTASRPDVVIRTMFDRTKEKPILVGHYVIHYADGKDERLSLEWEKTISQWNAQAPASFCQQVWQGKTKAGAIITLESLRWVNPRPEVPILSVDLESAHGKSAPVLLAITAVVE